MDDNNENNIENFIKIYSNDDEKMQKIGQILSTPKSRKIYGILIDKSLNAKEVAKIIDNTENPRLPNVIFHLEKMVDAGLLTVKIKLQRKHGHKLKYYRAIPFLLIVPSHQLEKVTKSKTLQNIFKNVFKISMSPIIAFPFIAHFFYKSTMLFYFLGIVNG
jgi:vacuolar-type H+-ATPase subunit F/Vma7